MMIRGLGIDIVAVERIERVLKKFPTRFPRRILHPEEYQEYQCHQNPVAYLARQFAAKEAISKALGVGFTRGFYPRTILVKRDQHGRPYALLPESDTIGQRNILISISGEQHYAVAQALFVTVN